MHPGLSVGGSVVRAYNSAETVQRTSVSSASVTKEVQKSHQAIATRDAAPRPVSSGQRINQVRKFTF